MRLHHPPLTNDNPPTQVNGALTHALTHTHTNRHAPYTYTHEGKSFLCLFLLTCAYSSDSWPVFVVPVPPLQTISEGVCVCGVSCCLSAAFVSGAYVCMYVCLLELLARECIPFMCCCRSGFYSFRTFVFLAFLPHSSHFFFRFFFRSRSTTFHCCLTDRNSRVLCYVTHTHTPIYKCQ